LLKCNWCGSEIKEKNWKYCKNCGSSTGFLKDFPSDGIEFPIVFEDSSSRYCSRCPFSDLKKNRLLKMSNSWQIDLKNEGYRTVKLKVRLLDGPDWIKLKHKSGRAIKLEDDYPLTLEVTGKIDEQYVNRLFLEIESNDEFRGEQRWKRDIWRKQEIPINFKEQGIGILNIKEKILLFNKNIKERNFSVINTGDKCFKILDLNIPEGFELQNSDGKTLNRSTISDLYWSCEHEEILTLKVIDDKFVKKLIGDKGKLKLTFRLCTGISYDLLIHLEEEEQIEVIPPRYIVGVDFGTENTSLYYLDVVEDKIEAIKINGKTSIPSYMYFYHNDRSKPTAFGHTAKEEAKLRRMDEGDLIKDIKLLLGSELDFYVSEYRNSKYTNDFLLEEFLCILKREIDHFISKKNPAKVKLKYVFTLPVLDNGEMYLEQKHKMIKAIKEVYSNNIDIDKDVKFIKEPQSAALCFFHPETLSTLNLDPFENGDTICIYDSGGGTTDIALLRINTGNGEDSFEVLGTLGTQMPWIDEVEDDDEFVRFAGRIVDDTVLELMVKQSIGSFNPSEEEIEIEKDLLFNKAMGVNIGPFNLRIMIELCKIDLDKESTINLSEKIATLSSSIGDDFFVNREDLHKELEPLVDETITMLQKLKETHNISKIKYIFPIGGNTRFPLVDEKLKLSRIGNQIIDMSSFEKIRMEAVARGSVLAYRATFSNLIPYDIYWSLSGDKKVGWEKMFYENNSLSDQEIERPLQLSQGDEVNVLLGIGLKDNIYCIGSFPVEVYRGSKDYRMDLLYFKFSKDWIFQVFQSIGETDRKENPFSYKFK